MKNFNEIPFLTNYHPAFLKIKEILPDGSARVQTRDCGEVGTVSKDAAEYLLSIASQEDKEEIYYHPLPKNRLIQWILQ